MEHQWEKLAAKALIDVTLPGSFRAGSTRQLSSQSMCRGGIHRDVERRLAGARNWSEVGLPWSIYQEGSISEQLEAGMRYMSFSLCSFGAAGDVVDPTNIFHQDGGFTSEESLAETLSTIKDFLHEHPFEVVTISMDSIYYASEAGSMRTADREELAAMIESLLAEGEDGVKLFTWQDIHATPLYRLLQEQKRVAIFMQDAPARSPVISREKVLPQTVSRDFDVANVNERTHFFMQQDLRALGVVSQRRHFHCVRIGPRVGTQSLVHHVATGDGPHDLQSLIEPVLKEVYHTFTHEAQSASSPRALRLNAVVAPFPHLARQWEVAMALMNPKLLPKSTRGSEQEKRQEEGELVEEVQPPTVHIESVNATGTQGASQGSAEISRRLDSPADGAEGQTTPAPTSADAGAGEPSFYAWCSLLLPLLGSLTLTTCVLTASSMMFETLPEKPPALAFAGLPAEGFVDCSVDDQATE